ncbi:hypothetical protein [Paraflavitalea speifideaquila]|uniref:hypothetical protein n=1 Tax=Paraflavitalea speifideaquila TaxID=3076558 RepID=UPI0028E739A2|nr:hypothetical protein [Paraflavitalea speifideiaquila]
MGVNSEVAIGGTGVFARAGRPINGKENGVEGPTCFTVTATKLNGTNAFPCRWSLILAPAVRALTAEYAKER